MKQPDLDSALDFDPEVYFDIVAKNLIARFGTRALDYADAALLKMRALGDDEGYEMWRGVLGRLGPRMRELDVPDGVALH